MDDISSKNKTAALHDKIFDLVIVGGGLNGTGIAREAALRGLSVCLLEQNDLASGASSMSNKLIAASNYTQKGNPLKSPIAAFKRLRGRQKEQAILLKTLPNFVQPLRLFCPQKNHPLLNPIKRVGLWLFDQGRANTSLPPSKLVSAKAHPLGAALKQKPNKAIELSECIIDDARLVILNAIEANASGAIVHPFTKVVEARCHEEAWHIKSADGALIKGRALVNATGTSVNQFIEQVMNSFAPLPLELEKVSYIIVPRLFHHNHGIIVSQDDNNSLWILPHQSDCTLIGTSKLVPEGEINSPPVSDETPSVEIKMILDAIHKNFHIQLNEKMVLKSGTRQSTLVNAPATPNRRASQGAKLILEEALGLPVIHIYGGEQTAFRILSETVVNKLAPFFPKLGPSKTATMPYTAFEQEGFSQWRNDFNQKLNFLPPALRARYVHSYGRRADWFLHTIKNLNDLGEHFGAGLYVAEVRYLITHEWARTSEDILWRRTQCGLQMSKDQKSRLNAWLAQEISKEERV